MKAAVVHETGGPLAFKIEERPMPTPKPGQVLIHIKASGLNRSELFTRQGHSPNVHFPRILGIEATGLVEDAPGGEFQKSDVVAAAMGEMGRANDGGYAECTVVPAKTDNSLPGPSSAPAARCCKRPTARCMTGIVGNSWTPATFAPMGSIPTSVCLTAYSGGSDESMQTPLQELVEQIEAGSLQVSVAKTFRLDEIADAHRMMEENRAGGKPVVLPWCDSLLYVAGLLFPCQIRFASA